MSRAVLTATIASMTALAVAFALAPAAGATPPPAPAASAPAALPAAPAPLGAGTPTSFAGVTVTVPDTWPLQRVDGTPGCVRYDVHAVYLGEPGESTCPARLIGRTSTVQILRGSNDAPLRVTLSDSGDDLVVTAGDTIRVIVTVDPTDPQQALSIAATATADGTPAEIDPIAALTLQQRAADAAEDAADAADTDETDPADVADAADPANTAADTAAAPQGLRSAGRALLTDPATIPDPAITPDPAVTPDPEVTPDMTAAEPTAAPTVTTTSGSGIFRGMAFDTCAAPSVAAMQAWRESSYGAVGIYIGGVSASCKPNTSRNPNLTADWVDQVARMGWKMIPIYVGLQAPGTRYSAQMATKPVKATQQGVEAAGDAVNKMVSLGLGPGNPIYLDVEAWNTKDKAANASVISFTHGWTEELHRLGYASGFYSSAGGGIQIINGRALSNPTGFSAPDVMWFARWFSQTVSTTNADGKKLTAKQIANKKANKIASAHISAQAKLDAGFLQDVSLADALWVDSQRGWQYLGGHVVEHGGFSINIDSNMWDGPVAPATTQSLNFSTTSIPTIFYNKDFQKMIKVKGSSNYSYAATGTLPAGITLGKGGKLSGRTTELGVWTVSVVATDKKAPWKTGVESFQLTSAFPDVPASNTFAADIAWLANGKVTTGYTDGTFRPNGQVTRGEMAAYLYRYANPAATPKACTKKAFTDVKKGHTFCAEITWLAGTGITTGYSDGTFRPAAPVSRQEMAAFLYRLQHPEEMAQLKADQAEDAATLQARADAVAAAKKAYEQAQDDVAAKKQARKDAKHSTLGPNKKAKAIAKAETALATAKTAAATAKQALADATAAATVPLPNRNACQVAPTTVRDIPAEAAFCRQISWLATAGVTAGDTLGNYNPAGRVLRGQMAAFLHRLADSAV